MKKEEIIRSCLDHEFYYTEEQRDMAVKLYLEGKEVKLKKPVPDMNTGSAEYGRCKFCRRSAILQRKYYYYDIDCECCNGKHFEFVRYCKHCTPVEPEEIKVTLKTKNLKKYGRE